VRTPSGRAKRFLISLLQDSRRQYLLTQGTLAGVHLTRSADGLAWQAPALLWRDRSQAHRPCLDSGVAQACLHQWPDGAYQLFMIRNQRIKYCTPGSSGYVWGGGLMLFTARSSDLKRWADWHLLSTSPSGALPNHCMVPGVGLVFYGSFADCRARKGEIQRRLSGRYPWITSPDGRCWTAHPGVPTEASAAIAQPAGGPLVAVRADVDESEQLPTLSFFRFQGLRKLLAGAEAVPLGRKRPAYGSYVVHTAPQSRPASRPASKP